MPTALEQFLSDASKPIEDPISSLVGGLAGGLETGVKLAESSFNLQQRKKEAELKEAEIKSTYLSKGINALSQIPKVKNKKQRDLLTNVTLNYLQQGGMTNINEDNVRALLDDPETAKTIADALRIAGETDEKIISIAKVWDAANADPEEALPKIAELKGQIREAEARGTEQSILEMVRQGGRTDIEEQKAANARKIEAQKQINALANSKQLPMSLVRRVAIGPDGKPRTAEDQLGLLSAYQLGYYNQINSMRGSIAKGVPGAKPADRKQFADSLKIVESNIGIDDKKAAEAMSSAEEAFMRMKAEVKPGRAAAPKSKDLPKELGALRKEAYSALKPDLDAIRAADAIVTLADQPGAITAGMILGKAQVLREGKISVLREGEYDRALKEQGISDRLEVFFKRISGKKGESLGPEARAEYKRLAIEFKEAIMRAVSERSQNILESARAQGATDDQIKKQVFPSLMHPYLFGQPTQLDQVRKPSPSEKTQKAAGATSAKKGKPASSLVESAKKQFPNDWKNRLNKIGYDTGGL